MSIGRSAFSRARTTFSIRHILRVDFSRRGERQWVVFSTSSEMSVMNPPLDVCCLIVLVGPPGSGKTTWARRNGRGAVHVSQDGLIDAITPDGFDHVWRPIYGQAEDAVARAAL